MAYGSGPLIVDTQGADFTMGVPGTDGPLNVEPPECYYPIVTAKLDRLPFGQVNELVVFPTSLEDEIAAGAAACHIIQRQGRKGFIDKFDNDGVGLARKIFANKVVVFGSCFDGDCVFIMNTTVGRGGLLAVVHFIVGGQGATVQ